MHLSKLSIIFLFIHFADISSKYTFVAESRNFPSSTQDDNASTTEVLSTLSNNELRTLRKERYQNLRKSITQQTRNVEIADYPFVVSIQKDQIHACCGTIVSNSWILTAAHCLTMTGPTVQLVDFTKLSVVGGQTRLGVGNMQLKRVKDIFLHTQFVKKMLLNDIGMINLFEPFELNEFVKIAPLSSSVSKPYKYFETCQVISWTVHRKDYITQNRLLINDAEYSKNLTVPRLQLIELPTISSEDCLSRIQAKDFLTDNQICTKYGTLKNVSCSTDAGSPLMCGDRQYGIFSWGIGCADFEYPGVFTRVASFRKWIDRLDEGADYTLRNKGTSFYIRKFTIMIGLCVVFLKIN